MASKQQIWKHVSEEVGKLIEANPKLSKKFKEQLWAILEQNLMPKNGNNSTNPPQEIDGVMHYYCRFHQRYEPEQDMVMSKGKSKGYCKASISKWNRTNAKIKKLDSLAVEAMSNGDFEKAKAIANESKELKAKLNAPEYYDFDEDWANFNNK